MPGEADVLPVLDIESFISPIGGFSALPSAILGTIPFFSKIRRPLQRYLGIDVGQYLIGFYVSTAIFFSLKRMWSGIKPWLLSKITSSISVQVGTPAYEDVLNWVTEHVINRKSRWKDGARALTIVEGGPRFAADHPLAGTGNADGLYEERSQPTQYVPSFVESTWIRRFWPWQHIYFHRERPSVQEAVEKSGITISCLGVSTKPLRKFVNECRASSTVSSSKITTFYQNDGHHWQNKPISRPNRPITTVDLDHGDRDALVADVAQYLRPATRRFYARRGIPYRRGYLFHGPPGTGKTSMSLALAGHFNLTLYILNLSEFEAGDSGLNILFKCLPEKCIVLLEDIDSAGINRGKVRLREQQNSRGQQKQAKGTEIAKADEDEKRPRYGKAVTLSGLLNTIDGVGAREGRVIIMTSNDPDALDNALIRPGRIDWMVYFGPVKHHMAKAIFRRMYRKEVEDYDDPKGMMDTRLRENGTPQDQVTTENFKQIFGELFNDEERLERLAEDFATKVPEDQFTPAEIQGFLLQSMDEPENAVNKADAWVFEMIGNKNARQIIEQQDEQILKVASNTHQTNMYTDPFALSTPFSSSHALAGTIPTSDPALHRLFTPKGRPTSSEERERQSSFPQQWRERVISRQNQAEMSTTTVEEWNDEEHIGKKGDGIDEEEIEEDE